MLVSDIHLPLPEYDRLDALDLASLVHRREVTPLELVNAAIARVEARNPALNAVIRPMFEYARAAAAHVVPDGPFSGVPMLLKDLLGNVAGIPTSNGNRAMRDLPMPRDSELVRRFAAAGALFIGKTNTPEYGLTPYTEPEAFGPTRNPWDPSRTSGGSSGGSASAVAARMVPIASGGDGGGSIRIPASCCGVFGIKPTRGRVPTGPDVGEVWHGFAQEHVLTRSVRDSAAMLDATAGADVGAPYAAPAQARPFLDEVSAEPGRLRIAFSAHPFLGNDVHADCHAGLAHAAKLLESLGHDVVEATPTVNKPEFAKAMLTILVGETWADIQQVSRHLGRSVRRTDFEIPMWTLGLLGGSLSAGVYADAARTLQLASREVARFFETYDVLLTPTLAQPPVKIGALKPKGAQLFAVNLIGRLNAGWLLKATDALTPLAEETFAFMPYTPVFNVTGQPAMSVPLYWNAEGLPIGMQFAARFGDEATLFRLAGQLERAQPWAARMPPSLDASRHQT